MLLNHTDNEETGIPGEGSSGPPRAGYNIYLGQGDLSTVNWANPAASAGPDGGPVSIHLPVQAGQAYTLAARAVSTTGVEERNTHIVLALEGRADSGLIQRLDAPTDLAAWRAGQSVLLAFRFTPSPGAATPESFDVFTDGGTGNMNLTIAVASLNVTGQPRGCFSIRFQPATLPAGFVVSARRGGQLGPASSAVQLAAGNPNSPILI